MATIKDIINSGKSARKRPDDGELKRLPFMNAYIYGRLSSPGQVRDSRESVREIARLVDLAVKDGYKTNLNSDDIETRLVALQQESFADKVWSDGEVTVDVRDLGLSGQLSFEDRKGLTELQRRVKEGMVGAVYLTEGVSRLSRDRDRILPYQLLKLLKEHECRIRTPEGVWNPAIERDWDLSCRRIRGCYW
jgi:DNA invertase Pin-like site-specific DNA recombinase